MENRCAPHPVTGAGTLPVGSVTLRAVQDYLAWLSGRTGVAYRLPTEAEWEYAARAGTTTAYWWGDEVGRGNADCAGCGATADSRTPAPVRSFRPNAFGLYDMLGNVFQWVADCSHPGGYAQRPTDGRAWGPEGGGDCSRSTIRGGAWNSPPAAIRSGARSANDSNVAEPFIGFRVARSLAP
jgi:formylglycine-generating enzyme required for sulfatase activity